MSKQQQTADVQTDLVSGDTGRQTAALMAISGMLASGRDVSSYVSLACRAILGSANTPTAVKCITYDLALSAQLSDSDWARIGGAIAADIQKGVQHELRVKALSVFAALPAHQIVALLTQPPFLERFVLSVNHPADIVRAAAIESLGKLCIRTPVLTLLSEDEEVAKQVYEAWTIVLEGLLDDTDGTVAAACNAIASVLTFACNSSLLPVAQKSTPAMVVSRTLGADIVRRFASTLGACLARFRRLSTGYVASTQEVLIQYLRALQPAIHDKPLDSLPGDPGPAGAARAHAFEETTMFLAELLNSVDPAVVCVAADGLFQLAAMDNASANLQALLPSAINAIVSIVNSAEDQCRPIAQPAAVQLLLKHMSSLPSVQRALLLRRLPPIIAAVPTGADRTVAFMQLWTAALDNDWASAAFVAANLASAGTSNEAAQAPSLVQNLLTDPTIKAVVAGSYKQQDNAGESPSAVAVASFLDRLPHPRYADPVFREELAGTLLYLLLNHAKAEAASAKSVTAASSTVAEASQMQALVESLAWLASAKHAMQGTKASLGWDRVAGLASTGATAVVDLWLQLLLKSLQLIHKLRTDIYSELHKLTAAQIDGAADPRGQALLRYYRRLGENESELQGLLLQIMTNWRALHPVARCRAIWVCVFHLKMRSIVDGGWNATVDALRGLLLESRQPEGASNLVPAVAEGILSSRIDTHGRAHYEAALAASASEQIEVAILCLERLASMVAYSNTGKLEGRLSSVAGLLDKVVKLQLDQGNPPAVLERLLRIQKTLAPVATSGREAKKQQPAPGAIGQNGNDTVQAPLVMDLTPDPSAPRTAAYPMTLDSSGALFDTNQAKRYRKFAEQTQRAMLKSAVQGIQKASIGALNGNTDVVEDAGSSMSIPPTGLPDLMQMANILQSTDPALASVVVTGPSSPIALSIRHSVEPATHILRVQCQATNRLTESVSGIGVDLLAGGPVTAGRKPFSITIGTLPAGETHSWDVELVIVGFGWPTIQASLTLPATLPLGQPIMRCKPYNVSPLQLLAPPAHQLSPSEFYQHWQALPHVVHITAGPVEQGEVALLRLLGKIETAGLTRVSRSIASGSGSVHAAYYGMAWSGETIACIVTGSLLSTEATAGGVQHRLDFHFGSETAEVVAHIKGHEAELLAQLTGKLAIPVASNGYLQQQMAGGSSGKQQADAEMERPPGTFSFFRSMFASENNEQEEEEDDEEVAARKKQQEIEHVLLESAVTKEWQKMRKLRMVA